MPSPRSCGVCPRRTKLSGTGECEDLAYLITAPPGASYPNTHRGQHAYRFEAAVRSGLDCQCNARNRRRPCSRLGLSPADARQVMLNTFTSGADGIGARADGSETVASQRWVPGRLPMSDVTHILAAIERGDPKAVDQLLPLVYDELRRLAAQRLAQERARTDLASDGPGARGLRPPCRGQRAAALGGARPFLRRRRRGHAPHPDRPGPAQANQEGRGRTPPARPRRHRAGSSRTRTATAYSPWTRQSSSSKRKTRARPSWSSSGSSPASPPSRRPPPSASPPPPPRKTGHTLEAGSEWRSTAYQATAADRPEKNVTGSARGFSHCKQVSFLSARRGGFHDCIIARQRGNISRRPEIADLDCRRSYVREACGGDENRIASVLALLAAADAPTTCSTFRRPPPRGVCRPTWTREPWSGDRTIQAAPADRRRRHGHRSTWPSSSEPVRRRVAAQDHQARHGQPPGHRPLRGRAAGAGDDGPPKHRPRSRRRHHGKRPALLRHGTGPRRADHPVSATTTI